VQHFSTWNAYAVRSTKMYDMVGWWGAGALGLVTSASPHSTLRGGSEPALDPPASHSTPRGGPEPARHPPHDHTPSSLLALRSRAPCGARPSPLCCAGTSSTCGARTRVC